ncbi:MAG: hypothetical protein HOA04_05940 [Euryarchaeota archaeon]|nr:hypothetical protein [Euryarchaeota archaeon]
MTAVSKEVKILKPTAADQKLKVRALGAWDRARLELVHGSPFLGSLAMHLQLIPVVDDRCPTAATDGRRVFFNAQYMLDRSEEDAIFILAHEVLHCALMHFSRQRGEMEEHKMWNYAIDHEVNAALCLDGMAVPEGAVIYPQFMDKSAEQVFELIKTKVLKMQGELLDDHDLDAKPSGCELQGPCNMEVKIDPDFTPMRSDSVWREWASKVMTASNHAQSRGESSASLQKVLGKLDPSKVDWETILRRWTTPFMGGSRTWLPPNRRYVHQGLYLPSRRGHRIDMVVVIDTSGSVWEHGVIAFLKEFQAIISAFGEFEITILQVDTEVRHVQTFDNARPFDVERFHIEGGGCNRFSPAFDWIKEEKSNDIRGMVYLTDGYLFTGDPNPPPINPPPYPVLWALTENGRKPVEWGDHLTLEHKSKP